MEDSQPLNLNASTLRSFAQFGEARSVMFENSMGFNSTKCVCRIITTKSQAWDNYDSGSS